MLVSALMLLSGAVGLYSGSRDDPSQERPEVRSYLHQRIEHARPRWIPATVLLREIRERGYDGGISQLRAWLAPLRKSEPEPVGGEAVLLAPPRKRRQRLC